MAAPATVPQRADELYVSVFYRVLMASMLNRALLDSPAAAPGGPAAGAREELEGMLELWIDRVEANLRYTVTAIRTLVQAQYGALLAVLAHVP